jgi:hypothetical protein
MTSEIGYDETPPPAPASPEPPVSVEAIMAVVFAALVGLAILFDAAWVGASKHAICDKWLAKGQADCAGSDGFREWGPAVVRQGLTLLVLEVVLIPAAVYLTGRLIRFAREHPSQIQG